MKGCKVLKRKLSWHFYAVIIIAISVFAAVGAYFVKHEEYACEMADLQAMRSAAMSAEALWYRELPEETVEYWYDATTFSLVPITDSKPSPCGRGTSRFGGAARDFMRITGIQFSDYDESESYLGKLPHVVVHVEQDELIITVDWVNSDNQD